MRLVELFEDINDYHEKSLSGVKSYPSTDQYYDIYRLGVAIAGAGRPEDEMKGESVSPYEDNPITLSYTAAEEKIINMALKKMGIKSKQLTSKGSKEPKDTNTTSPMTPKGPIKRRS